MVSNGRSCRVFLVWPSLPSRTLLDRRLNTLIRLDFMACRKRRSTVRLTNRPNGSYHTDLPNCASLRELSMLSKTGPKKYEDLTKRIIIWPNCLFRTTGDTVSLRRLHTFHSIPGILLLLVTPIQQRPDQPLQPNRGLLRHDSNDLYVLPIIHTHTSRHIQSTLSVDPPVSVHVCT